MDVCQTLIDLLSRTWHGKVEYGKEAAHLCGKYEFSDMKEVFEDDLSYRNEDHFKILQNVVISII